MSREPHTEPPASSDRRGALAQYLTFILDDEEYGVDILRVQEIKGWHTATSLPNTPEYVRGVINLRGTIVPIIDLRLRFGLEEVEYSKSTVVIVLQVQSSDRTRIMGVVVDAVSDVYDFNAEDIKEPPKLSGAIDVRFVRGIAAKDQKMIILLDIDHLLECGEATELPEIEH